MLNIFRKLAFFDDQATEMDTISEQQAIENLVMRVDAQISRPGGRIIGFIASGSGEGTSSLSQTYALAWASQLRRRVLLLRVLDESTAATGILATLAAGESLDASLRPLHGDGFAGNPAMHEAQETQWDLLARADLWQKLRDCFDDIVIDLPATSTSRLGLVSAVHCDGVVVILEAEKTRAPVAESLIASLRAVRAPILGIVLNKRRYYLPKQIYRLL